MTLKLEPLVLVYAGYAGYPGPHRGVAFRVDINTPGILLAGSTQECAPLHSKKVQVRSQSVIQDSRERERERESEGGREGGRDRDRDRDGDGDGDTHTQNSDIYFVLSQQQIHGHILRRAKGRAAQKDFT